MYMTAIYLGKGNDGYQTDIAAAFETPAATKEAFESLRKVEVSTDKAPFLIDLKTDDGDIIDSIGVSEETYSSVTGQPVYSKTVYKQIDKDYWHNAGLIAYKNKAA